MTRPTGQKRQAAQAGIDSGDASRRTRSKVTEDANHNKRRTRSSDQSLSSAPAKKLTSPKTPPSAKKKFVKKGTARPVKKNAKLNTNTSSSSSDQPAATNDSRRRSFSKVVISSGGNRDDGKASDDETEEDSPDGPSYWLMKAEPDSRIEKGNDVKFSIDDLKKASEPEAWDGECSQHKMAKTAD